MYILVYTYLGKGGNPETGSPSARTTSPGHREPSRLGPSSRTRSYPNFPRTFPIPPRGEGDDNLSSIEFSSLRLPRLCALEGMILLRGRGIGSRPRKVLLPPLSIALF